MNREERRGMKDRLLKRLKKAKSYITLTFDGRGLPICSYDLTGCTDKNDIRHVVMHECSLFVEKKVRLMRQGIEERVAEIEQAERVKKAKEKRSEELAAADEDFECPSQEDEGTCDGCGACDEAEKNPKIRKVATENKYNIPPGTLVRESEEKGHSMGRHARIDGFPAFPILNGETMTACLDRHGISSAPVARA